MASNDRFFRHIVYWDAQQQREFEFFSNHLTLNAVLVAAVFIGLLIIAMTHELFEWHLMSTAEELLMNTLPGILGGFALTIFFRSVTGKTLADLRGYPPGTHDRQGSDPRLADGRILTTHHKRKKSPNPNKTQILCPPNRLPPLDNLL